MFKANYIDTLIILTEAVLHAFLPWNLDKFSTFKNLGENIRRRLFMLK